MASIFKDDFNKPPTICFAPVKHKLNLIRENFNSVFKFEKGDVPTEALVISSHTRVPGFVYVDGVLAMSQDVCDWIESVEPSRHQFVPFDIKTPKRGCVLRHRGRDREIGKYYVFNVGNRVDAVCIEKSDVFRLGVFDGKPSYAANGGPIVLWKELVQGMVAWSGVTQVWGGYLLLELLF